MKKGVIKKVIINLIIIILLVCNIVFASVDVGQYSVSDGSGEFSAIGNKIVRVFQIIGTIFALGTLLLLGVKVILASPSEKADLKNRLTPYIVGAVMVFSIVNLLQIVWNIMN